MEPCQVPAPGICQHKFSMIRSVTGLEHGVLEIRLPREVLVSAEPGAAVVLTLNTTFPAGLGLVNL